MKKVFEEPSIRRFELNMQENIANSSKIDVAYIVFVHESCYVWESGFTLQDVKVGNATDAQLGKCVVYVNESTKMRNSNIVTRKELLGY